MSARDRQLTSTHTRHSQRLTGGCELADPCPEAAAQVCGTPYLADVTPDQLREVPGVLSKPRGVEVVELDLRKSHRVASSES